MPGTLGWVVGAKNAQAFLGKGYILVLDADLDPFTVITLFGLLVID